MKTLVIGGTGTVGTQVVRELVNAGKEVRVLTTSPAKAATQVAAVETVVGNTGDRESLAVAMRGVSRVFMVNAHTLNEVEQGQNVIAAAKAAGVQKFVYQSIHKAKDYSVIPHVHSKALLEEAIKESGLNYTSVCPNNFFQNDLWFRDAILRYRIYPQPLGDVGLSRNDVRDIAEVAVKALFSPELDGMSIPIVGPDILTGAGTAKILTEILGFPVQYAGNDLVSWAKETRKTVPEWMVDDWTIMYKQFQEKGLIASQEDLALLTGILGRAPRSYSDFIRENKTFFSHLSKAV